MNPSRIILLSEAYKILYILIEKSESLKIQAIRYLNVQYEHFVMKSEK